MSRPCCYNKVILSCVLNYHVHCVSPLLQRKRKLMEEQRAQLATLQQQQQKARSTWSGQHLTQPAASAGPTAGGTKSLLEIQQEQAKQEMLNMHQQQRTAASVAAQVKIMFAISLSLSTLN